MKIIDTASFKENMTLHMCVTAWGMFTFKHQRQKQLEAEHSCGDTFVIFCGGVKFLWELKVFTFILSNVHIKSAIRYLPHFLLWPPLWGSSLWLATQHKCEISSYVLKRHNRNHVLIESCKFASSPCDCQEFLWLHTCKSRGCRYNFWHVESYPVNPISRAPILIRIQRLTATMT